MISMPPFSSMPGLRRARLHEVLAPDQDRRAEPLVGEAHRGADHRLLLALGEDDRAAGCWRTRAVICCSVPAIGSRRAESCWR